MRFEEDKECYYRQTLNPPLVAISLKMACIYCGKSDEMHKNIKILLTKRIFLNYNINYKHDKKGRKDNEKNKRSVSSRTLFGLVTMFETTACIYLKRVMHAF